MARRTDGHGIVYRTQNKNERRNHFGSILRFSLSVLVFLSLETAISHHQRVCWCVCMYVNSRTGELVHNLFIVYLSL